MAGFPAPRLVRALVQLAPKSNAAFQHWGDADVGGLSTYYFLRPHLACPLMLRRTTADWVTSEPSFGGRPVIDGASRARPNASGVGGLKRWTWIRRAG